MAAQEYYSGTQGVHELPGNHHQPNLYPSPQSQQYQQQPPPAQTFPQQQYNAPTYANTPPPTYSAYAQPPQQQPYGYPPQPHYPEKGSQVYPQAPPPHQSYSLQQPPYPEKSSHAMTAPYPQTPPTGYYPSPPPMPQQQNGYLGAPLQPYRSHSQPARVRFADQESDRSTSLGSISDSDDSPPRHKHHRHRSHSDRTRHSDRDRDVDYSDYSDRERSHRHRPKKLSSYEKAHEEKHKTRDTFLGAGAGTIIGDVIFPGLGTAAGLVLGGYGGRKYADKRSKSEGEERRERSHGGSRRAGDDGWDEKSRTYRKGAAVR